MSHKVEDLQRNLGIGTLTHCVITRYVVVYVVVVFQDKVHTSPVTSVCWSPDGFTLFSSSEDGLIAQWDLQKAQLLQYVSYNIAH